MDDKVRLPPQIGAATSKRDVRVPPSSSVENTTSKHARVLQATLPDEQDCIVPVQAGVDLQLEMGGTASGTSAVSPRYAGRRILRADDVYVLKSSQLGKSDEWFGYQYVCYHQVY